MADMDAAAASKRPPLNDVSNKGAMSGGYDKVRRRRQPDTADPLPAGRAALRPGAAAACARFLCVSRSSSGAVRTVRRRSRALLSRSSP